VLYLMEDMATGEIRLSILWEWLHKGAVLTADEEPARVPAGLTAAPPAKAGDRFTRELFLRLLAEEFAKLQQASDRDVYDESKQTTLPVAREIAETYVTDAVKMPWYIDLLNATLGVHDLGQARARIRRLAAAFAADGTRITENLDF
jgi:malate synthase